MKPIASAFLAIALAMPVSAQTACAPRQVMIERLASAFGEARVAVGLIPNGNMFELFGSSETGTWTVVITRPDQLACMVSAGEAFEVFEIREVKKGDPT